MPDIDDPSATPDISEWADGPDLVALWGDDQAGSEFRLGTREYDWHSHLRGQVFCVESGLVHMRTARGSWLSPPNRAGWIPPGMAHKVVISGANSGWSMLISPRASRCLPDHPCVLGINELMRALVRRAASWSALPALDAGRQRVVDLLLDEIARAPHEALHLPLPLDRRLLRITSAIVGQPGIERTLEQWAAWAGLSARTLSRLFQQETGSSFAQWRQQAGLVHAMELLAQGQAVGVVADALGYASPSNFIAMFRRNFGDSPARYFAQRTPPALHPHT